MKGFFHVLFDREPEVVCHTCVMHKAFADALGCGQDAPGEDCDHVQYIACTCDDEPDCVACVHLVAA